MRRKCWPGVSAALTDCGSLEHKFGEAERVSSISHLVDSDLFVEQVQGHLEDILQCALHDSPLRLLQLFLYH